MGLAVGHGVLGCYITFFSKKSTYFDFIHDLKFKQVKVARMKKGFIVYVGIRMMLERNTKAIITCVEKEFLVV